MVFCEFSALNPSPSQTAPRGFALRGAREFGHSLAFGSKLSESFGRAHLAIVPYISKLNLKRAATVPGQRDFFVRVFWPISPWVLCHDISYTGSRAD
jgi:hypothetical protein